MCISKTKNKYCKEIGNICNSQLTLLMCLAARTQFYPGIRRIADDRAQFLPLSTENDNTVRFELGGHSVLVLLNYIGDPYYTRNLEAVGHTAESATSGAERGNTVRNRRRLLLFFRGLRLATNNPLRATIASVRFLLPIPKPTQTLFKQGAHSGSGF